MDSGFTRLLAQGDGILVHQETTYKIFVCIFWTNCRAGDANTSMLDMNIIQAAVTYIV